jgi:hypothetical protein
MVKISMYGNGEVVGFWLTDGDDRSRKFYADKVGIFLTKNIKVLGKLFLQFQNL